MRWALLQENGDEIVNVIDGPDDYVAPAGWMAVLDDHGLARIGGRFAAGAFVAPSIVERVPEAVAMWQAKAALELAGLLAAADAAITSSSNIVLRHAWRDGNEFHRSSPAIADLGALLGLTSVQIDDLFRAASRLAV